MPQLTCSPQGNRNPQEKPLFPTLRVECPSGRSATSFAREDKAERRE